jgi:uncharacterized protein YfaS (alpha-2-macroglobulin family)/tetratricopeptide (TPR) repeat protein
MRTKSPLRLSCVISAGFVIALLAGGSAHAQRSAPARNGQAVQASEAVEVTVESSVNLEAQADAAGNEKSYTRQLALLTKGLAEGTIKDRDDAQFKIAVALGKTNRWDEAIAAGEALLLITPWKARVYYWLGRLYTEVPHNGWKVGGKVIRGDDYPKVETAEKPQQVWLNEEDAQKTLDYFEKAKLEALKERDIAMRTRFTTPPHPMSKAEEIDLNFDLAAWLGQREYDEYIARLEKKEALDENIDVTVPYDRGWHLAKKVLYLYNQIRSLDDSKTKHDSALSLLSKGLWVRSYRQRMEGWARQWDDNLQKQIVRAYPFDHLEPYPSWEQLVREFPRDPIADRTQLLIAQTRQTDGYNGEGDLVKALAEYRRLIQLFPRSKFVNDARMAIQEITKRGLTFDTMGQQPSGKKAKLTVSTRNLKQVEFRAYMVKLENIVTRPEVLNNHHTMFGNTDNLGKIADIEKKFGAPVATWRFSTNDKSDYRPVGETIDTPLQTLGAYVIVGHSQNVRFAQLLVISDLAIIKKIDRDAAFAFVVDARTGEPVNATNVVLKEVYYDGNGQKVNVARGTVDDAGFFDKKVTTGPNHYSHRIEAFAYLGNRYSFTGQSYYGGYYGDNRDELKIYSYTDRPVYRPEQKVYFRQILTQRVKGGDNQPVRGMKVKVTVNNPKGEKIYDQTLTSSEFGTINGEFDLADGAPLGEYSINAQVDQTTRSITASGGNRFRVEEYKRPEFAVTIDAPEAAVRPGETVAAKINAKYYFGSPVPNATVKYTVRRSTWWSSYRFPSPYDWLYRYWNVGDYDTGRRNIGGEGSGTIVKEGTVKTDAQGNAEVSFTASRDAVNEDPNNWWRYYSNPLYTVEAEVTNASRRTIEGQGSVRVANQQYFAFLDAKRGYYLQGDRVQIELVTQNANDKPVRAAGKMVVYKLLPNDKEEKVYEEAISTDATGRTFWNWPTDQAGSFRVAYESTDDWGNKVVGSTTIWVGGEGLNTTQFRLQGVTIVLEKRAYEEGDTLKALLIADMPDSTILLTQEAGGEILRRDVIHIAGKSREITIPIRKEHVPNFAIAGALVKNYEIYQTQQEVFVPPTKQVLNIAVSGDKSEYKPGEKGTFSVKTTDWQGNPVRTEVSLALVDASLFYIQKDYAPDIRTFYYGDRRAISVNIDSSRSGRSQGTTEDDLKYLAIESHGFELPDDLGQLNLDPSGGWGYYPRRRRMSPQMLHRSGVVGYAGGAMAESASMDMLTASAPGPAGPPPPSPAPPSAAPMSKAMERRESVANQAAEAPLADAQVRSNFAETAVWSPAVVTEGGTAKVEVTFPDSLTQWHATARGLSQTAQVGAGESDVETKKNLLVRLQAPRFFVERDQVVLSANVHNYLKTDKRVKVSLATGDTLKLNDAKTAPLSEGTTLTSPSQFIDVKAGEEVRVNWMMDVVRDGKVSIQMSGQSDEESDAVKMEFPVLVHGVQRFAANTGVLTSQTRTQLSVNFPKERRFGASTLNVQLNPSLAATMLDALPYLADYPYGCVEQTMSRFLPTVVAAKTLRDAGINLDTLRTRAKAYEAEAKTEAVGARVKNTGYTYPTGMPNSRDLDQMASRMWHTGRSHNPLFDKAKMDDMVKDGLQRLYGMQRSDGGWGWWPGSGSSDEYMSAYVMYGLWTAKGAGENVRDDVLSRGYAYLNAQMKDEENIHRLTYIAYALSQRGNLSDDTRAIAAGRLFEQRERLTAYSKALLAMALWNGGEKEKAAVLVRNLENTAVVDKSNDTARWRMQNQWWYWWNNDVETNAVALRAFVLIDPKNTLTPMIMKWLTTKSRGSHWRSTKETSESVYALASYVQANDELDVDYTLKVSLNGKIARSYRVTRDNALFFDNRFITGDLFLQDGANALTIEKQGKGTLYWSAASEYFSLEEPIKASGNEIAVKRRYFKLTRNPNVKAEQGSEGSGGVVNADIPDAGGAGLRKAGPMLPHPIPAPQEPEFTRVELTDNAMLQSGDLVEVELTLDSANDYEYLVFEDMKAAGLEPVDLRSGGSWGDGLSSNVELRDEKVAFFVDRLPQGTRVLRYRMRAEIPGRFHALPTNGYAMYAPEVRAISDEMRMGVED